MSNKYRTTVAAVMLSIAMLPTPTIAQSSLSDQRLRCDELRSELASARRKRDMQESRSEAAGRTDTTVIDAMRTRGRSDAMIRQYQLNMDMQRRWSGNVEDARRAHNSAIEAYEMQGCSTGGQSNYDYEGGQ